MTISSWLKASLEKAELNFEWLLKERTNDMIFATFFPACEDIHLTKEVGLIPYILCRDYGYDSYIICFKNGDYHRLNTDARGLKLLFMNKCKPKGIFDETGTSIFSRIVNIIRSAVGFYSLPHAFLREIDVLNLYHVKPESLVIMMIFRAINKHGIVYLKMDLDPGIIDLYNKQRSGIIKKCKDSMRTILFKWSNIDIISVETKELYDFLLNRFPATKNNKNLHYLPTGIDTKRFPSGYIDYDDRGKLILHVARIGSPVKRTDIVLESFAKIVRRYPGWKLILIGEMGGYFQDYYNKFLVENEDIRQDISYLGFINDRDQLYKYYFQAKIFFFPSLYESFGLAGCEAGACGVVIIGSDITALRELTKGGEYGYLCPINNRESFINTLDYMIAHEDELRIKSAQITNYIRDNYDIGNICANLHNLVIQKLW